MIILVSDNRHSISNKIPDKNSWLTKTEGGIPLT